MSHKSVIFKIELLVPLERAQSQLSHGMVCAWCVNYKWSYGSL